MPLAALPSPGDGSGRRLWRDEDPIVSRPAHPEYPMPTFGMERWSLECVWLASNRSRQALTFARFDGWAKLTAKELMATRLNTQRRSRCGKILKGYKPKTLIDKLSALDAALGFMRGQGIAHLPDLTPEHLERYVRNVLGLPISPSQKVSKLGIFVWLWEDRHHLTHGGLAFEPFRGVSLVTLAGVVATEETTTPRIPPDVIAGLMQWAMAYVDDFSDDIIAADRAYDVVQGRSGGSGELVARLTSYVAQLRTAGESLPGIVGQGRASACLKLVAARANVPQRWLHNRTARAVLDPAVVELGLEPRCLGSVTHVPEGCSCPWRSPMSIDEMKSECRHLISACYVVCAYLSGMRDFELQSMRRGCLREVREADDPAVQYRVTALAGKHLREAKLRTWVVIEPVARAIRVLERILEPVHRATGDDHLFVRIHYGADAERTLKQNVGVALRAFMAHCDEVLAPGLRHAVARGPEGQGGTRLSRIPDGPDGTWDLQPIQFRKTLAWHVANRKFGLVAGAIQYGHASLRMFEGYAGNVASGFPDQLRQEEMLARAGDLTAMFFERERGIRPVGPVAAELEAEFDLIRREVGALPGEVVDEKGLRKHLRSRAATMRVGVLADCFFDPGRARCLEHLDLEMRHEPVTGLCDPRCERACWAGRHVGAWQQLLSDAERYARVNSISDEQRTVLRAQTALARHVISQIPGPHHGG